MTDRELLELAAKAAGLDVEFHETLSSDMRSRWEQAYIRPASGWNKRVTDCKMWSPLTDDGDALRLAVKLGFNLYLDETGYQVEVDGTDTVRESNATDPLAATRRAIVRAAAAVGSAS